ncbi:MAG: glycerophosphodiester phosphodiesterase [Bacteroidaceae bacterium]|nr:glycerophosphodiester phosphodiesterase [Bacteroidaceae bacterium]
MNCKKIILTLCLGLFALTGFAQPHILSHRGFYTNPKVDENSIDALREAQRLHHDMGLEACEFDVHMTADGELVVRHDNKIEGRLTCQGSKLAEIKAYTLLHGSKIPTLREWFQQAKRTPKFKLALELKSHPTPAKETEVVEKVVALAREMDMMDQLCFLSFSLHACKEFVRLAPGSYVILNSSNMNEPVTPAKAKELGFAAISYHLSVFMNHVKWIDEANQLGLDTYLWMCEDPYLIDWATAYGVTWITTDYADRMLPYAQQLAKDRKRLKKLRKSRF